MKYSIIRVISFQANFGSEVESMKDEIINKIIDNLKNTNEYFLIQMYWQIERTVQNNGRII